MQKQFWSKNVLSKYISVQKKVCPQKILSKRNLDQKEFGRERGFVQNSFKSKIYILIEFCKKNLGSPATI